GSASVVSALYEDIAVLQYPPAAASAVVLVLVVMLMITAILRTVDVRRELARRAFPNQFRLRRAPGRFWASRRCSLPPCSRATARWCASTCCRSRTFAAASSSP